MSWYPKTLPWNGAVIYHRPRHINSILLVFALSRLIAQEKLARQVQNSLRCTEVKEQKGSGVRGGNFADSCRVREAGGMRRGAAPEVDNEPPRKISQRDG